MTKEKRKAAIAGGAALVLCCGPSAITAVISRGSWPDTLLALGMGMLLGISLLVWVFDPPGPDSDYDF